MQRPTPEKCVVLPCHHMVQWFWLLPLSSCNCNSPAFWLSAEPSYAVSPRRFWWPVPKVEDLLVHLPVNRISTSAPTDVQRRWGWSSTEEQRQSSYSLLQCFNIHTRHQVFAIWTSRTTSFQVFEAFWSRWIDLSRQGCLMSWCPHEQSCLSAFIGAQYLGPKSVNNMSLESLPLATSWYFWTPMSTLI